MNQSSYYPNIITSSNIIYSSQTPMSKKVSIVTGVTAEKEMTTLPEDFVPSPFDVICCRGRKAKTHPGNIYFQSLIQQNVEKYANAKDKITKTVIVSEIIDKIRERTTIDDGTVLGGSFVKQTGGQWFDIGEVNARERVGQNLRDQVKGKYKSSATSKRRKRDAKTAKMVKELDNFHASDSYVSKRIKSLTETILTREISGRSTTTNTSFPAMTTIGRSGSCTSSTSSDDESSDFEDNNLLLLMTEANCDILRQVSCSSDEIYLSGLVKKQ